MRVLVVLGIGLASVLGTAGGARGQFGLPGSAAAPAPTLPAPASSPAGAAAAPRTIWGFLGITKANLGACKDKLCGSQAGQMLNNGMKPFSMFSGGVIPEGFCPTLPPPPPGSNLAGPAGPGGAQAAAAAVQQDQASAPARIAAIEYLATVDCHYWPEATAALIGRLRGDRVECVRYAAAKALGTGCCCTAKTVEALANVLADRPDDNFPSENSERVKATAFQALQRCMACIVEDDKPPQAPPEPLDRRGPRPLDLPEPVRPASATATRDLWTVEAAYAAYYDGVLRTRATGQVLADARRVLGQAADARAGKLAPTTGSLSVVQAIARSASPLDEPVPPARKPARAPTSRPRVIGLLNNPRPAGPTPPSEPVTKAERIRSPDWRPPVAGPGPEEPWMPSYRGLAGPARDEGVARASLAPAAPTSTGSRGLFGLMGRSIRPASDSPR